MHQVSVLFNEPKLLKLWLPLYCCCLFFVSVLFNEPKLLKYSIVVVRQDEIPVFQCSSTSRNC